MTNWIFKRSGADECIIYSDCRWRSVYRFYGELAAHRAQDFQREVRGMDAKSVAKVYG